MDNACNSRSKRFMATTITKKPNQPQSAQKKKVAMSCCSPASESKQKSQNGMSIKNGKCTTKIVVKFNCGFTNTLSIRGEGLKSLSWNKGCPMKNVKADEWCWETDENFKQAQFKVLINDKQYELGENHTIECGKSIIFAPKF